MTTHVPATLASLSGAMDGGFIAIADVASAMSAIGATADYRLIGGSDASTSASAAVDLLVPAYTSRPRQTKRVGDMVTTEVPRLAVALRRPGIAVDAELVAAVDGVTPADIDAEDAPICETSFTENSEPTVHR